ncbi:MAG: glycosyltransferase family 4 protein [Agathobacter sp.]
MKVVLLAPTPPPIGGIAQWTVRMMEANLKNGWEVIVVDEKILGKREFFGNRVRHNYVDEVKRCLSIWKRLWKALEDKDVKVVHSCIAANTMPVLRELICAIISKICGRKFIIHFRCTIPNIVSGKLNRLALKMICDISDCVMVLNNQSENYVKTISSTQTCLIPNFVKLDEISHNHLINEKIKRVVYVGGVIETKGCIDIIHIAQQLPDIEFRLVGNPEQKVIDEARGINNVVLTGPLNHEQVQEELVKADVFVFLSYFEGEGFSNALAEAMANGLPCIVSDWAANADMIEDQGGEVVPVRDIDSAVSALKRMFSSEVRRKQSVFNVRKVESSYRDDVVQEQYVDCYERVLKG